MTLAATSQQTIHSGRGADWEDVDGAVLPPGGGLLSDGVLAVGGRAGATLGSQENKLFLRVILKTMTSG